jgi:hypothetical protein
VRRMEFLTKADCEPDPIYVKSEGGEEQDRLERTTHENANGCHRAREGSAAERYMAN